MANTKSAKRLHARHAPHGSEQGPSEQMRTYVRKVGRRWLRRSGRAARALRPPSRSDARRAEGVAHRTGVPKGLRLATRVKSLAAMSRNFKQHSSNPGCEPGFSCHHMLAGPGDVLCGLSSRFECPWEGCGLRFCQI